MVRLHPQQPGETRTVRTRNGLGLVECPILFARSAPTKIPGIAPRSRTPSRGFRSGSTGLTENITASNPERHWHSQFHQAELALNDHFGHWQALLNLQLATAYSLRTHVRLSPPVQTFRTFCHNQTRQRCVVCFSDQLE